MNRVLMEWQFNRVSFTRIQNLTGRGGWDRVDYECNNTHKFLRSVVVSVHFRVMFTAKRKTLLVLTSRC